MDPKRHLSGILFLPIIFEILVPERIPHNLILVWKYRKRMSIVHLYVTSLSITDYIEVFTLIHTGSCIFNPVIRNLNFFQYLIIFVFKITQKGKMYCCYL